MEDVHRIGGFQRKMKIGRKKNPLGCVPRGIRLKNVFGQGENVKNTFLEGRQSGILAFEFPRNTAVEREVRLIASTDSPSGKIPSYRA